MDEEGHAQEEEEVHNGEVEDENIRHSLFASQLLLLNNSVDDNEVPHNAQEADDAEETGHYHIGVWCWLLCYCQDKPKQ